MPETYLYETETGEIEVHIHVRTFADEEAAEAWLQAHNLAVFVSSGDEDDETPELVH